MKNKVLFGSLISLILGIAIYLLFRKSSLKVFSWLKTLNIDFFILDIRKVSFSYAKIFPNWFLYSLPDGLWISSYVCLMIYIWNIKITSHSIFWISAIPIIAVSSEIGQAINLVPGTFDSLDLLFYLIGFILPLIIIFKNKHYKLL